MSLTQWHLLVTWINFIPLYPLAQIEEDSPQSASLTESTEPVADSPQQNTDADGDSLRSDQDDGASENLLRVDAPTACNCTCCTKFDVAHQPTDLERSKSKSPHGQQKSHSRSIGTHGSVCTHHPTNSFVTCAVVQGARTWLPSPSATIRHLLKEVSPIGRKCCSDSPSTKKAKCTRRQ